MLSTVWVFVLNAVDACIPPDLAGGSDRLGKSWERKPLISINKKTGRSDDAMLLSNSVVLALVGVIASAAGISTAEAGVLVRIDKSKQLMIVSVDNVRLHTWRVSTGLPDHDTPNGQFKPLRLALTHFSKEWDDAPMPHSIFFTSRGHAIHGSLETRLLGRAASHGCIRLAPKNAEKLFTLVKQQGLEDTDVVIDGNLAKRARKR